MRSPLNYREQTDEMLVRLTLVRDEAAFEELVKRHERAALLIAQSVTKNLYTAEDAVQDAFLTAWQRLDTLKDPAKFGPWVCRIAKYRAINLAKRYRDYIPFDEVENYVSDVTEDISGYYDDRLETEILRACVEKLSEKIGTVIRLHYFEGLSISDIAKRTRLAEGTVKSRLSAGREQIRKELGYMDKNKTNETLVEAVMRRVEEFKQWRLKNSKKGFEEDYDEVLSQVESLPDSEKKFYAMADVMQLGMWYLPASRWVAMNREAIREAAIKGNNKEVLATCIQWEVDKYAGQDKVEHVYDVAIPELNAFGSPEAVATMHYILGNEYFDMGDLENARREWALTAEDRDGSPMAVTLTKGILSCLNGLGDAVSGGADDHYFANANAIEMSRRDQRVILNHFDAWGKDRLLDDYWINPHPHYFAAQVDSLLFDEAMQAGDSVTDSTGKNTLTCIATDVDVETPCGVLHHCTEMHTIIARNDGGKDTFVVWYKRNIGIVAYGWVNDEGNVSRTVLTAFHIEGGLGYIPMAVGNSWDYITEETGTDHTIRMEITLVKGDSAYLSTHTYIKGRAMDENSWRDNMYYAANCFHSGFNLLTEENIFHYYDRADELATTPWERKMTEVSRNVMTRIFNGYLPHNPDARQWGARNYFVPWYVEEKEGRLVGGPRYTYQFGWNDGEYPRDWSILAHDILGILHHHLGHFWNDEWLKFADKDEPYEYRRPSRDTRYEEFIAPVMVRSGVSVETAAGKFENCLHLQVIPTVYENYRSYACHRKDYYFALGIGLVRVKTYGGADPVYDLVAYEGTGEGYMPVREGLVRRYEYVGTEERIHAGVNYYYLKDDEGNLCILADQIGMIDV